MVILTDSQPNSPLKTQHTWSQPGSSQPGSSQPATSQFGSEPPRSPYGALSSPPGNPEYVPPPAYVPGSNAPLLPGPPQKARPSVAKRFFTALGYALLIYGFFWILLYPLTHMSIDPYEWDNKPRPEDGNIVSCENSWSKPEKAAEDFVTTEDNFGQTHLPAYPVFSSSESFTLPINRSLHYLLARGTLSSGAVIVRGSEGADPNVIGVEVNVHYRTSHALARARVCQLERPEGGVGVGIFTPSNRIEFGDSRMDSLEFTVTVTIPTSRKSVLDINAFDTNMPNFRQKFESLGDRVQFEHLSVQSSNGAIESSGVYVSQGTVKSSNGRITGQYNASDSLVLQTSNGAIDVDVGITNDDTHKTSDLSMKTSNGRIASRISLLTTHNLRPQPKGGHFKVRANTTNGRLDVTFPTSPIDSLLDFYGKTTNGVADVSLHAAYEGTFSLTSSGSVAIDNEHAVDPTGKGRYRTISTTQKTRTSIEGQVFWGHEWDHHNSAETGQAVVQTSNGWARLRFV